VCRGAGILREELQLVADRLCEAIGKAAPQSNPLIDIEKQMDELRRYEQERDDRATREMLDRAMGRTASPTPPVGGGPGKPR
jgi:hypothetical protein